MLGVGPVQSSVFGYLHSIFRRCLWRHRNYPDMPCEPKRSFNAVADYYARNENG